MRLLPMLGLALLLPTAAHAVSLNFGDFSSTDGLTVNGDAAAVDDGGRNVLRLTPSAEGKSGSTFSTSAITLGNSYSFSTRFTFNINSVGGIAPADGLAFVVQTNANDVGNSGAGIGYEGIPNSLAIEFDTFPNGDDDAEGQHVGIDKGGSVISIAASSQFGDFSDRGDLTAWVDFNGATNLLEVRLSADGVRPEDSLLSQTVDLGAALGSQDAYVGFTSGTGSGYENHDLVAWQFTDDFAPIPSTPEPGEWAMMAAGLGIVGAAARRRRRR